MLGCNELAVSFVLLCVVQEDFFAGATNEWVFTPANPFQCLTLFIANDVQFEGPIPETIRASFIQDALLGPQEALICIVDDEPGKVLLY